MPAIIEKTFENLYLPEHLNTSKPMTCKDQLCPDQSSPSEVIPCQKCILLASHTGAVQRWKIAQLST